MSHFDPKTLQAIARRVRRMLGNRRPKTSHDLAIMLAASKIVTATLEKAGRDLPADVRAACDELSVDLEKVMDLVRW